MPREPQDKSADIQPIRDSPPGMAVSEELGRLTSILRDHCPADAVITFEYDGALHLHIDMRQLEDVAKLEALLPSLCGGIFQKVQRGLAAHHPFFHRVSALVIR